MDEPLMIPDATSSLDIWLTYLTNQHNKIIDMSIDRVASVAKKLNLLNPAKKVVTVAGTNGKGTTCHVLELILIEAGLKVGVYSSPHLLYYTERVRINGKILPEKEFCNVFDDIESKRGIITLTYFEYTTLAALQLFKKAKLDVVILEVGLGGRLDATNVVNADISVITTIALDHIDYLGSNLEKIAYEKAGIFRSGRYAIVGEENVLRSINNVAKTVGAKLFLRGVDWKFKLQNNNWNWRSNDHYFKQLPLPNVPLDNAATALAVIDCLIKDSNAIIQRIEQKDIYNGLIKSKLPGRFQIICKQPYVILDVAHNCHAASYLAKRVSRLPKKKNTKVYGVVAMLADKDIKNTLSCLVPHIDKWYLASISGTRGADSGQLAQYVDSPYQFDTVKNAWSQVIIEAKKHDIILVYGSFHVVSEIMKLQKKEEILIV
ncbi:MAG: bifunctional tetrahydrofolate synthase/dihydrofolate synthase [Arsenophonus sp.]